MSGVAGKTDVRGGRENRCAGWRQRLPVRRVRPDEAFSEPRDILEEASFTASAEIRWEGGISKQRIVIGHGLKGMYATWARCEECELPESRFGASFTASGGTTSAFSRDTLGGGHQQPQIHSSRKRKWGQPEVGSLKGRCYYLKKRTAPVDCD
ncbi:hypothetical protein Bbelb_289610 [Branchiostoma belcheri]|nr:hypothetical protein Bbelb_289610 [Branchiostoma belcheri]